MHKFTDRKNTSILILCLWLALAGFSGSMSAQADVIADALHTKATQQGSVHVIVQLKLATQPEGKLRQLGKILFQRRQIAAIQSQVITELAANRPVVKRRYQFIPYLAMEVNDEALRKLAKLDRIATIQEDRLLAPTLMQTVPIVQADLTQAMGYDGAGWTVAVLDTGVEADHPFLNNKVIAEACFSTAHSCPNNSISQSGTGAAAPCNYSSVCNHGTHVAGIIAGKGSSFNGVAPGATLIAIQVFSKVTGPPDCPGSGICVLAYTSDIVAGLEQVYQWRHRYPIAAVNMSLGGDSYSSQDQCNADDPIIKAAIDNLRSVGIATVIAAGNSGSANAIASPGCISSAISVGATNDSDQVASFSNSAPFLSLLAPGVSVYSSVTNQGFADKSGTSMATPHVAGGWAILKQFLPSAEVDRVLSVLTDSGQPIVDSRNNLTKPRIRLSQALSRLSAIEFDHAYYRCNDQVGLRLVDTDLAGTGSIHLTVTGSGGDMETVELLESASQKGLLVATIPLRATKVTVNDGIVQAQPGETLHVAYQDMNDGSGSAVTLQAQAAVDCQAPVISAVSTSYVSSTSAHILTTTDELTTATVSYGTSCANLAQSLSSEDSATSHELVITGLTPVTEYFFAVQARDQAGNVANANNQGTCYSLVTTPAESFISLKQGFNLFSYPGRVPVGQNTCQQLLTTLGAQDVIRIQRYNYLLGRYESCDSENLYDFAIQSGEAYIINLHHDKVFNIPIDPVCFSLTLYPGLNLIGYPMSANNSSCFGLLTQFGTDKAVSLQRFNNVTGRFESCLVVEGNPAGIDFPIAAGEGYIVSALTGFTVQPVCPTPIRGSAE